MIILLWFLSSWESERVFSYKWLQLCHLCLFQGLLVLEREHQFSWRIFLQTQDLHKWPRCWTNYYKPNITTRKHACCKENLRGKFLHANLRQVCNELARKNKSLANLSQICVEKYSLANLQEISECSYIVLANSSQICE